MAANPHPIVTCSKTAKFDDVRDDLKLAIEAKGLVIDYESYINRMLERTGKDVGSTRKIYADAQGFVFCSAVLSRKTMEADPANIAQCPYSMVVYATVEEPEKVHVAYRRRNRGRLVKGVYRIGASAATRRAPARPSNRPTAPCRS